MLKKLFLISFLALVSLTLQAQVCPITIYQLPSEPTYWLVQDGGRPQAHFSDLGSAVLYAETTFPGECITIVFLPPAAPAQAPAPTPTPFMHTP